MKRLVIYFFVLFSSSAISSPNLLNKISFGEVISISDVSDVAIVKKKDGTKQRVKTIDILGWDRSNKLQAGQYIQFYEQINQDR